MGRWLAVALAVGISIGVLTSPLLERTLYEHRLAVFTDARPLVNDQGWEVVSSASIQSANQASTQVYYLRRPRLRLP